MCASHLLVALFVALQAITAACLIACMWGWERDHIHYRRRISDIEARNGELKARIMALEAGRKR
jgi:hypothetical protein